MAAEKLVRCGLYESFADVTKYSRGYTNLDMLRSTALSILLIIADFDSCMFLVSSCEETVMIVFVLTCCLCS